MQGVLFRKIVFRDRGVSPPPPPPPPFPKTRKHTIPVHLLFWRLVHSPSNYLNFTDPCAIRRSMSVSAVRASLWCFPTAVDSETAKDSPCVLVCFRCCSWCLSRQSDRVPQLSRYSLPGAALSPNRLCLATSPSSWRTVKSPNASTTHSPRTATPFSALRHTREAMR